MKSNFLRSMRTRYSKNDVSTQNQSIDLISQMLKSNAEELEFMMSDLWRYDEHNKKYNCKQFRDQLTSIPCDILKISNEFMLHCSTNSLDIESTSTMNFILKTAIDDFEKSSNSLRANLLFAARRVDKSVQSYWSEYYKKDRKPDQKLDHEQSSVVHQKEVSSMNEDELFNHIEKKMNEIQTKYDIPSHIMSKYKSIQDQMDIERWRKQRYDSITTHAADPNLKNVETAILMKEMEDFNTIITNFQSQNEIDKNSSESYFRDMANEFLEELLDETSHNLTIIEEAYNEQDNGGLYAGCKGLLDIADAIVIPPRTGRSDGLTRDSLERIQEIKKEMNPFYELTTQFGILHLDEIVEHMRDDLKNTQYEGVRSTRENLIRNAEDSINKMEDLHKSDPHNKQTMKFCDAIKSEAKEIREINDPKDLREKCHAFYRYMKEFKVLEHFTENPQNRVAMEKIKTKLQTLQYINNQLDQMISIGQRSTPTTQWYR